MLKAIEISNFRGLADLSCELESVTALLGPNSSGKTTVLQAIRVACELFQSALESGSRPQDKVKKGAEGFQVADNLMISEPGRLVALQDWRAFFVDRNVGDGVWSRIHLTFDNTDVVQELRIELGWARNDKLKYSAWVRSEQVSTHLDKFSKKSSKSAVLIEQLKKSAPLAILIPPFYGTVTDEEYRANVVIDRLLGSGDQSRVVRNLVAGLDQQQFERLNALLKDLMNAKLTYRTSGDALQSESPLRVHFADTNGGLELSAAGAGLINLLAVYASLARWYHETKTRSVIYLLDEPEAHLHPRLQADSSERLARLVSQEFSAQLVLASHSVDILNRLSRIGARLIRVDRLSTPSAIMLRSDSELIDALAAWVDLTPFTAINFLASRQILFCEGDADITILNRVAELAFRNRPTQQAAFRRWLLVRLHGAGNQKVSTLLGQLLSSEALKVQAEKTPFRLAVVLDRDHTRTPQTGIEMKDGLSTWVWSRHSIESLFMEPELLTRWVATIAAESSWQELFALVSNAIHEANTDPSLREEATQALVQERIQALVRDGVSLLAQGGKAIGQVYTDASTCAAEAPEQWQRGKDRAQFVLGKIRAGLPAPVSAEFPTRLDRLIAKANLNRIGEQTVAIPAEIMSLLTWMVA